jgi:hypothetical protein
VFEAQLADDPNCLDSFQVLVSTAKLIAVDAFFTIAQWVETRGGVFVCTAGSIYIDNVASPPKPTTVGACFNEFFEFRPNRLNWLLGGTSATTVPPTDDRMVTARGAGFVIVPREAPGGDASDANCIGNQYMSGLEWTYGYFVESKTLYGSESCATLSDVIDRDCPESW